MINQQMQIYKYAQSHIINLLHHYVSVTLMMMIIRVSYNKHTTDVKLLYQNV